MSDVVCFLIVPGDTCEVSLRRYTWKDSSPPCVDDWGHGASVQVAQSLPWPENDAGYHGWGGEPSKYPKDDPRWPVTCERCDYVFVETDEWQENWQQHWVDVADVTRRWPLRQAPAGAMFYSDWNPHKGPDGRSLSVCLPPNGGDNSWCIDAPATQGGGHWTRSGTPPLITATPSILTPHYHGFLTDGRLVEC